jgi:hypothetical protein
MLHRRAPSAPAVPESSLARQLLQAFTRLLDRRQCGEGEFNILFGLRLGATLHVP